MTGMYFCMLQISPNVSELSLNDFASFQLSLRYFNVSGLSEYMLHIQWVDLKIFIAVARLFQMNFAVFGLSFNVNYKFWLYIICFAVFWTLQFAVTVLSRCILQALDFLSI